MKNAILIFTLASVTIFTSCSNKDRTVIKDTNPPDKIEVPKKVEEPNKGPEVIKVPTIVDDVVVKKEPQIIKIKNLKAFKISISNFFDEITIGSDLSNRPDLFKSPLVSIGKDFLVDVQKLYKLETECKYIYKFNTIIYYLNNKVLKIKAPVIVRQLSEASNTPRCEFIVTTTRNTPNAIFVDGYNLPDKSHILEYIKRGFLSKSERIYREFLNKNSNDVSQFELTLELKDNLLTVNDKINNFEILLKYDPDSTNLENMFEFGNTKEIYESYNEGLDYLYKNDAFYFKQEADYSGTFSSFVKTKGEYDYIIYSNFSDIFKRFSD